MNLWQYQVSNEQFKLPPRLINENEDEVSLQQHVQPSPPQKSIMSSHSLTKSLNQDPHADVQPVIEITRR